MNDLTVRSDTKVAYCDTTVLISTYEALSLICLHCGNTKNVYLHYEPTAEHMRHGYSLPTGSESHDIFQQCRCYDAPLPEEGDARETPPLLPVVSRHSHTYEVITHLQDTLRLCQCVQDVAQLVSLLMRALDMRSETYRVLSELYIALGTCQNIEHVQRLLGGLFRSEETA